jgi:chorismate synthase
MGTLFRIATWGESHGGAVGVVVDGCPPRIPISAEEVQVELDRRRPGQSKIVSQRKEADQVQILSGIQDGLTLGTPISMLVWNEDARPQDYDELREKFRPSHADFTYRAKYGIRAWSGGGRASARETVGRVAAGAIARKLLALWHGVEIVGWVEKVRDVRAVVDPASVTRQAVESNDVRCPDADVAAKMRLLIEEVRKAGDSVGGVLGCVARGVPPGWGDPVFDKLEADLAKAVMSLPACKGFEVGSGFAGTDLTGSQHNDEFYIEESEGERGPEDVYTPTNLSGGIQGGISNGMPLTMRAAFKPTATILRSQHTVSEAWQNTTIAGRGRHDPCVLPRAVPMVEAMVALVLADAALRHRSMTW